MVTATTLEAQARIALDGVMDPEIPACSITGLGMVERVAATEGGAIEIDLIPTFLGCPAQAIIQADAERAVRRVAPGIQVRVRFVLDPPWTTDRISPEARAAMTQIGIAPPERTQEGDTALLQVGMRCPWCGHVSSTLSSAFGPTPCRTIRHCPSCLNPFEGFKTKERS